MVVVQIEPDFRPMDRSGIGSGTRAIAMKLWKGKLPNRLLNELVRELYDAENKGKAEPSGSQDMIGLIYPGVNRLDYDLWPRLTYQLARKSEVTSKPTAPVTSDRRGNESVGTAIPLLNSPENGVQPRSDKLVRSGCLVDT